MIPKTILKDFEKEIGDLKFGKVTLGVVLRDGHKYYEINKFYTIKEKKINIKDKK